MNNIAKLAARYALTIEPSEEIVLNAKLELNNILKKYNIFGVFVTISRGYNPNLNKHEKIHGCIGQWNIDYNSIFTKELLYYIKSVSYSAANNDSRKDNHPQPLKQDEKASIKISFMLLPILTIDKNTGIIKTKNELFNNAKYGLIAQSTVSKSRGTYLPDVFTNNDDIQILTWKEIRNSVFRDKAGGSNLGDFVFYAYETLEIEDKLLQHVEIGESFNNNISTIERITLFFLDNYKSFIPYYYKNNQIYIDKENNVRNIATIHDLIVFGKKFSPEIVKKLFPIMEENLNYYLVKYIEDPSIMRQASSFLMLALFELDKQKYKLNINKIRSELFKNIDNLELDFEFGQVIMALTIVKNNGCQFCKYIKRFLEDSKKINDDNRIFRYNWHSQFLLALHKTNSITCPHCNKEKDLIFNYAKLIKDYIVTYSDNQETNYLAVSFESLCALKNLIYVPEEDIQNLFQKLKNRFKNGLFFFTDGTARIDITGHVMQGLVCL